MKDILNEIVESLKEFIDDRYDKFLGIEKPVLNENSGILKEGKIITVYRGIGYNQGNNYYSPSKEFAMEFTRSGRESELRSFKVNTDRIYKHNPLPKGYGIEDPNFDLAIKIAQKQGYNAMWVDEGHGQPNSVFIINPSKGINEDILKKNILRKLNEDTAYNFTEEDLDNCWQHYKSYLIDILNGEYDLNIAREDLQSLIGSKYDKRTENAINEEVINEQTYKVYHGTNQQFDKFDFKKTAQGIIWFTDSLDSIKKGEHGGQGNKYIMTRYITINNPAGWAEYEKYGLQQLEDMGYDGVILPQGDKTDYFVFSNKNIRKTGPKEL